MSRKLLTICIAAAGVWPCHVAADPITSILIDVFDATNPPLAYTLDANGCGQLSIIASNFSAVVTRESGVQETIPNASFWYEAALLIDDESQGGFARGSFEVMRNLELRDGDNTLLLGAAQSQSLDTIYSEIFYQNQFFAYADEIRIDSGTLLSSGEFGSYARLAGLVFDIDPTTAEINDFLTRGSSEHAGSVKLSIGPSPVPEPGGVMLAGVGLFVFLSRRRKGRR